MKRNYFIFVILGLIFLGVSGCDKFNAVIPKKPEVKIKPVTPQVKGVVIAKVNNISKIGRASCRGRVYVLV